VGAKVQLIISWVLDVLEKGHYQHLTQHGQGFLKIQSEILTTSGLFAVNPKIAIFSWFAFLAKKFRNTVTGKLKQLQLNLLRAR
jgi:hypothetical protein